MCTQPLKKKTIKTEFKELICSLNDTICDAEKWIEEIINENKKDAKRKIQNTTRQKRN